MGNRTSARTAKAISDAIDRQLKVDARRLRKECKVLLIGSGESGKSTIVKQMKIMHQNGFTDEELMSYRPTIYRNTLDSAQAIVLTMRKFGLDCVNPNNRLNTDRILDYRIDPSPTFEFSSEIAQAIHQLWKDPIIPELMDHSGEFYLMDSAIYFFTDVLRIGSPNYLPTTNDVLRAHLKTTGINETWFSMGKLRIHMIDPDNRSERKKWIHCFESVTSIVFCAALGEYDQVLLEKKKNQESAILALNRMIESLILFESVVNSRWFSRTSIILLLNKIDVFKAKLPKAPLERYFPEYSGGADIDKAAKYILWRFMQSNRAGLSVYPHFTQATNTAEFTSIIFAVVKETILSNAVDDCLSLC